MAWVEITEVFGIETVHDTIAGELWAPVTQNKV